MMTAALIIGAVVVVIPFWRLFPRMGYPSYYALAMLLPFINIGLLYYVAFLDWPIQRAAPPPAAKWS
jgi:hypothetical protein